MLYVPPAKARVTPAGSLEAVAVSLLMAFSAFVLFRFFNQPYGVDFAPLWVAASDPSSAYDVAAVSKAQVPLFGDFGPRPFAYPPTALLLLIPFAALPFAASYALFTAAGWALFMWSALRAGKPWWLVAFPPVAFLAYAGQTSLWVGGLLLSALLSSDWRVRGLLFGIAGAFKPQLCIFIPVLLMFERDWRSFLAAGATATLLALVATVAFGVSVWTTWVNATFDLIAVVDANPILQLYLIDGSLFFLPVSLLLAFLARGKDPAMQLGLVGAAALLVSPYAMVYDLALLAPAVAGMLVPALVLGIGFFFGLPVVLFCAAYIAWRGNRGAGDAAEGLAKAS